MYKYFLISNIHAVCRQRLFPPTLSFRGLSSFFSTFECFVWCWFNVISYFMPAFLSWIQFQRWNNVNDGVGVRTERSRDVLSLRLSSALDFYDYLIRTCLVIFWMCTFYSPHGDTCACAPACFKPYSSPWLLLCGEAVQGNPACRHLWRLVTEDRSRGQTAFLAVLEWQRETTADGEGGVMNVTAPSCSRRASSRTSLTFLP